MNVFDESILKKFKKQDINEIREFLKSKYKETNRIHRFIDSTFKLKEIDKNFKNIISITNSALHRDLQSQLDTIQIEDQIISQRIKVILFCQVIVFTDIVIFISQQISKSHNPNANELFVIDDQGNSIDYHQSDHRVKYFEAFSNKDAFQGYLGESFIKITNYFFIFI